MKEGGEAVEIRAYVDIFYSVCWKKFTPLHIMLQSKSILKVMKKGKSNKKKIKARKKQILFITEANL